MSAVWRIFRKDLRRFWPLGAASAAIALLLAFFPALVTGGSASSILDAAGSLHWMILGVTALVVVQDDLVVSDRADWITRPLGAGSVLSAKLLFIVAVLILPFGTISFLSALQYGLGVRVCALVALDAAAKVAAGALFFAFVAAATASFLGAILAFAGLAATEIFLQAYLNLLLDSEGALRLETLHPSSVIAAAILAVGLLVLLYRWRQARWSVAGLILALGALAALERYRNEIPPSLAPTAGVSVAATTGAGFAGASLSRPFPLHDGLVIGLEVTESMPAGQDIHLWPQRVVFRPAGGERFAQKIPNGANIENSNWDAPVSTSWSVYARIAQAEFGVILKPYEAGTLIPVLALSGADFERLKGQSGALALTLRGSRNFVQSRDEVPVDAGGSIRFPGMRLSIQSVRATGGPGIQISIRKIFVNSRKVTGIWPLWALVNRRTGEVSLDEYDMGGQDLVRSYLLYDWRSGLLFAHRWKAGSDRIEPGVDASWLKEARLVCIALGSEPLGSVELTVPRFTLPRVGGIE